MAGGRPQTIGKLENLSLIELIESFANELVTYRMNLSANIGGEEEREQSAIIEESKKITEEYTQRTKALREEVSRRERLYLEYHNSFIGH